MLNFTILYALCLSSLQYKIFYSSEINVLFFARAACCGIASQFICYILIATNKVSPYKIMMLWHHPLLCFITQKKIMLSLASPFYSTGLPVQAPSYAVSSTSCCCYFSFWPATRWDARFLLSRKKFYLFTYV
jgi:hypothetical protein